MSEQNPLCPDCGAKPGQNHLEGCDVERCPECGDQRLSCGCDTTLASLPWTGKWPGVAECEEFGWYSNLVPGKGWVSCQKADEGAGPDLNRLYIEARWDQAAGRFVKK